MSRVGKQIIVLPEKVEVKMDDRSVSVRGPLGELRRDFESVIEIKLSEGELSLAPRRENVGTRALWGTYASHLKNMVEGVTKGYEKKLIIEGVGFRAAVDGGKIKLNLGFSHPIEMTIPEGLKVISEKNVLTITGIDKELVGQFTADIRGLKKPEPYKGKGIRYQDEVIRRKEGKRSVA